jgi:hypothetical protein
VQKDRHGDGVMCSFCSSYDAKQNFIFSDDFWKTDFVSQNSVKSVYGSISTACPINGKSFLTAINNGTFSDISNIAYYKFTLITTHYGGDMTQRLWSIQQATNEKLCLTYSYGFSSVFFAKCNSDYENQLYKLSDFEINKDVSCQR